MLVSSSMGCLVATDAAQVLSAYPTRRSTGSAILSLPRLQALTLARSAQLARSPTMMPLTACCAARDCSTMPLAPLPALPAPPVSFRVGVDGGMALVVWARPASVCSPCASCPPATQGICLTPLPSCPAGTYRESLAPGDECVPCSAGSYSAAGAAECTPCKPGTATSKAGTPQDATTQSCPACPAGRYSQASGAQFCSAW